MTVEARADGTGVFNGRTVRAADGDVRALLIQLVSDMAAVGKTPVVVQAQDPNGTSDLVVWPDGAVTPRSRTDRAAPPPQPSLAAFAQVSSTGSEPEGGQASSGTQASPGGGQASPGGGQPPQDAPSGQRGTWYIEGASAAKPAVAGPAPWPIPGAPPKPGAPDAPPAPAASPAGLGSSAQADPAPLVGQSPGVPTWAVRLSTGAIAVEPNAPDTTQSAPRQPREEDPARPEDAPVLLGASLPGPSAPPVALGGTAWPGPHPGSGPGKNLVSRIVADALSVGARRGWRLQQVAAVAMTGVLATMGLAAIVYTIQGQPAAEKGPAAQPLTGARPSQSSSTGGSGSGQASGASNLTTTPPATPATTPKVTPVARAQLPTLAAGPYGFASRPAWALAVDPATKVAVGSGGIVFTRTPDGALAGLDGATGAVAWTATGQWGAGWDGPWATRVDGRSAVAVVSSTELVYWPLPDALTGGSAVVGDQPVRVPLPAGSAVRWAGPSPAIVPAGGGAGVIREGILETVALPVGVRVLAADGTTVIAVSSGQWIRVQTGAAPAVHPIPTPSGLSGPPLRVEAVGADLLFAVWPKPKTKTVGHTYMLWDTRTGKTLLTRTVPPSIEVTSRSGVVRQLGGLMTGLGTLVVDTNAQLVRELLPEYQIRAVTPGHVIATSKGRLIDIGMSTEPGKRGFTLHPYPAGYPLAAALFASIDGAGGGRTGLVLHPQGGQHYLLGLPGP